MSTSLSFHLALRLTLLKPPLFMPIILFSLTILSPLLHSQQFLFCLLLSSPPSLSLSYASFLSLFCPSNRCYLIIFHSLDMHFILQAYEHNSCTSLSLSLSLYIYIYIYQAIEIVRRLFSNLLADQSSIPYQIITKTQKMVLDASCLALSIIRYGSRISGAIWGKRGSSFPYTSV